MDRKTFFGRLFGGLAAFAAALFGDGVRVFVPNEPADFSTPVGNPGPFRPRYSDPFYYDPPESLDALVRYAIVDDRSRTLVAYVGADGDIRWHWLDE